MFLLDSILIINVIKSMIFKGLRIMTFTFNSSAQQTTTKIIQPDPPDGKGNDDSHINGKGTKEMTSFRDKVIGNQVLMEREKMDLLATKKSQG